ncbi:MAG: tRNA (N6-isopentenyl adenosine(37)-C2)-methylthiotransferase MiaB [Oscillospiraceae bacterium]|nr:tRNA (N6-isopentenyl adenosine(37)-C2)-methylthiotransferase MiaB [Oscillospiraceae bacterium]
MAKSTKTIDSAEIQRQIDLCAKVRERLRSDENRLLAMVDTYGCQQNEADSEKIRGYLAEMGFGFTQDEFAADIIVVNTCAVREHAEMRVLGNVGALNHTKKARPGQVICVCGCMVQQEHMARKIKMSYPIVDLVFGPHELWRFPELLLEVLERHKRVFATEKDDGAVAEGIPLRRDGKVKAWLSIMYGCNNFCSYCIVPYVRGRERSRQPEDIVREAEQLIAAGYKDITLLGQNVNSYGKDLDRGVDFADLLKMINAIPGDFLIRFMTSHPKDATEKLFKTMAECEKCARHLHLPVQSGNDRILKVMNRNYDSASYIKKLELARSYMPDLVVTTDIIVGFPGETEEEFNDTLKLCEKVRFDAMFTFIYSKRVGTPAASMPDPYSREEKQAHFDALTETANRISGEKHKEYEGKTVRVLIDGETGRDEYNLSSRTNGGRLVHLKGDSSLIGQFKNVRITASNTWALYGEIENG